MRRSTTRIIALILVLLLGIVGIVAVAIETFAFTASAEGAMPRDSYAFDIQVLDQLNAVRVDQALRYTNRTGQKLSQVLFNLYPNAYRRQMTAPFEMDAMQGAYPDGFTPGGADFFLIEVNGRPADWGVQGNAEAFLRVAVELAPGASCTFRFGYELLLPHCQGPLGVTRIGYRLGGFYPMVAPWDDALKEFSVANVQAVGKTLFADPADYTATIDAPKGAIVAAPGALTSAERDGRVQWTIRADGVWQLCIVLSARAHQYERATDSGVKLIALMEDGGGASRALDAAAKAVDFYAGALGPYPLDTLVLAQVEDPTGADVSSGMILIDDSLLAWDRRDELEYQVALGAAKQWFGEKVGNNPAREPWLSEATSAYMALRYYGHAYGQARFLTELNVRTLPALKLTMPGGVKVDSETIEFASVSDYLIVVRDRGAASMYELSLSMGEGGLYSALRRYIDENAGHIASLPDFARALNESSGREMDHLLMNVLQNIQEYVTPQMDWYE